MTKSNDDGGKIDAHIERLTRHLGTKRSDKGRLRKKLPCTPLFVDVLNELDMVNNIDASPFIVLAKTGKQEELNFRKRFCFWF